jgi:hypothetical protein
MGNASRVVTVSPDAGQARTSQEALAATIHRELRREKDAAVSGAAAGGGEPSMAQQHEWKRSPFGVVRARYGAGAGASVLSVSEAAAGV